MSLPEKSLNGRKSEIFTPEETAKIRRKTAAVVGLGALGQLAAEEMVRGGMERLILIDGDRMEPGNLNRQICADILTMNQFKAAIVSGRLSDISPRLKLKVHPVFLDRENGRELTGDADLILDCTDNVPSKLYLEELAEQLGIPLIHGGVEGWCGQAAVIFPGDGILKILFGRNSGGSETGDPGPGQQAAVLMPAAAAVASVQAAEALKIAAGMKPALRNTLLSVDMKNGVFERIPITNGNRSGSDRKTDETTGR